MARSIAKGPKPRAGYATVNKNAPKPYAKAPRPAPVQQATTAKSTEPLGTVQIALLRAQKHGLAKIDARILLLHTLGKSTTDLAWLVANDNNPLSTLQADVYSALCARRRAGEPVAYIVGHKAFYGLKLAVDKRVLDPRDDTETLVDWALELLPITVQANPSPARSEPLTARSEATSARSEATSVRTEPTSVRTEPVEVPPSVLDLGTGSGAIALAIQSKRPGAQVHATDASADALALAQTNATSCKLPVQFHQGHWLGAVAGEKFDMIVSNPPYIAAADPHLAALTHEPLQALASGADGLDAIRQIIAQAHQHLNAGGWLLLEHGYDQAEPVTALLRDAGFGNITSRLDIAGIARCSGGQL